MRDIFESLRNRFHTSATCVRLLREMYLDEYEGADGPKRTLPCVTVRNDGNETIDLDGCTMDRYAIVFRIVTRAPTSSADRSIGERVDELRRLYHNQSIVHSAFDTVGLVHTSSAQPGLNDAAWEAELSFSLTVVWKEQDAILRYR